MAATETEKTQGEQQYLDLLSKLLEAPFKPDRTDTGTYSIFGHQMRFDLNQGFPLLTTKKVHFHSIVVELLWFLKGNTNIKYLLEHGVHIWTDWRLKTYNEYRRQRGQAPYTEAEFESRILEDEGFDLKWGDIGKGYGHQWRNFGEFTGDDGFDQISWLINEIKTNPDSRRLIVSGWNPHEVNQVDLPPCHTLFQFYVQSMTIAERHTWFAQNRANLLLTQQIRSDAEWYEIYDAHGVPRAKLSCQLYQRSCDTFLGLPFNIASYALLTRLIANECGLGVGDFVWTGGDVHLYSNHVDQAKEQLSRTPYPFPKLDLNIQGKSIFDLEPHDIGLLHYNHHPVIKADVAV